MCEQDFNPNFVVESVDSADGSREVLFSADNSAECREFLLDLVRTGQAHAQHTLIEIYDLRDPFNPERLAFWEKEGR